MIKINTSGNKNNNIKNSTDNISFNPTSIENKYENEHSNI